MTRICFFAHYDRDHQIDDYVIHYLRHLLTVVDKIIFASDSNLSQKEQDKLKGLATVAHAKRHGEYDFGSWKCCFQKVEKSLSKYDELVLANDSCFGPFHSLTSVFDVMKAKKLDAWGVNWAVSQKQPYLDAAFMVLKKNVFMHSFFSSFFKNIRKEACVADVVSKYEISFSSLLRQSGFSFDAFIPIRQGTLRTVEAYTSEAFKIIQHKGYPFLKTKIVKTNPYDVGCLSSKLDDLLDLYPVGLIKKYTERMCGTDQPKHFFFPYSRFRSTFLSKFLFEIVGKYTKSRKWFRIKISVFKIPLTFWIPVLKGK